MGGRKIKETRGVKIMKFGWYIKLEEANRNWHGIDNIDPEVVKYIETGGMVANADEWDFDIKKKS